MLVVGFSTDFVFRRLRTVEVAVRYRTDKAFTARLQRAWDRIWKRATTDTLSQCCDHIKAFLPPAPDSKDANAHSVNPQDVGVEPALPLELHPTTPCPQPLISPEDQNTIPTLDLPVLLETSTSPEHVASPSRSEPAIQAPLESSSVSPPPTGTRAADPSLSPFTTSRTKTRDSAAPRPEPALAQRPATPTPHVEVHVANPPVTTSETKTKDTVLGGFKVILKSASGVADVIPDPVGKIVKMIADTGIKVMDVLDVSVSDFRIQVQAELYLQDVNDNKDDAMKLGAHIRSLVQAIVQYLPHKKGMSEEGIEDVGLGNALDGFLRYGVIVNRKSPSHNSKQHDGNDPRRARRASYAGKIWADCAT